MMKRADLEELLNRTTHPVMREYGHLVPCLIELYRAGMNVKQLQAMFPVGRKFIRGHLRRAGISLRTGRPEASQRPTPARILAILKKHGVKLEDLTYRPRKKKP